MAKIHFGEVALAQLNQLLQTEKFSTVFFLTDENTHEFVLPKILSELPDLEDCEVLEVEPGEDSKSPEVLVQLWLTLNDLGADRHSLIVNVGGGMITDLGGFLAATYMRGIAFVNMPTSLLAMADASVGGKTGINLDHVKNAVGAFRYAEFTGIIPRFLETLPEEELRSGYVEMLKHGLLADKDHMEAVKLGISSLTLPSEALIETSVNIKRQFAEEDFTEKGKRKALNLGHTLGHAFETVALNSGDPMLHGEAIALGLMGELLLSVKYLQFPDEVARNLCVWLAETFQDVEVPEDTEALMAAVLKDKKNHAGSVRFSLLKNIGEPVWDVEIPEEDYLEAIEYVRRLV